MSMLSPEMPTDRSDETLETRAGVDTIAVVGPTTEDALLELRHQQYERQVDRETGELTDTPTYCFLVAQVGYAWVRVHGFHRQGEALLRVELSLPTMLNAHNTRAMPLALVPEARRCGPVRPGVGAARRSSSRGGARQPSRSRQQLQRRVGGHRAQEHESVARASRAAPRAARPP